MKTALALTLTSVGITQLLACSASPGDDSQRTGALSASESAQVATNYAGSDAGGLICPTGGTAGNANGVCSPDSTWKSYATSNCTSQGFELGAFTPSESCGSGSSDSATWTCCTATAPPEPTCSIHELTSACATTPTLEADAKAKCVATGQVLQSFVANDTCKGGESTAASYTCCPAPEPALPAFPAPPTAGDTTFTWAFYDNPQADGVFKNIAPHAYVEFSAREGQTFSATLTAMKSAEIWTPDPSKQIDGALFEGEFVGGSYVWTQLARGASEGGVLDLTARSGGSDRVHIVAYEASASSYPSGTSPEVSASLDLTCATGNHADCALGGEPGDSCTISPASCDGPVTWCFSPEGACTNAGKCERIDIGCSGIVDPVCTCSGITELNACYATIDKESLAHNGECESTGSDGGGGRADASAPVPKE